MNADGSNPRNLTRIRRRTTGRWVRLVARRSQDRLRTSTRDTRDQDNPELYLMDADGSNSQRLTRTSGAEGLHLMVAGRPEARLLALSRRSRGGRSSS